MPVDFTEPQDEAAFIAFFEEVEAGPEGNESWPPELDQRAFVFQTIHCAVKAGAFSNALRILDHFAYSFTLDDLDLDLTDDSGAIKDELEYHSLLGIDLDQFELTTSELNECLFFLTTEKVTEINGLTLNRMRVLPEGALSHLEVVHGEVHLQNLDSVSKGALPKLRKLETVDDAQMSKAAMQLALSVDTISQLRLEMSTHMQISRMCIVGRHAGVLADPRFKDSPSLFLTDEDIQQFRNTTKTIMLVAHRLKDPKHSLFLPAEMWIQILSTLYKTHLGVKLFASDHYASLEEKSVGDLCPGNNLALALRYLATSFRSSHVGRSEDDLELGGR